MIGPGAATPLSYKRLLAASLFSAAVTGLLCHLSRPVHPAAVPLVWASIMAGLMLDLSAALYVLAFVLMFDEHPLLQPPLTLSISDIVLVLLAIRCLPILLRTEAWTRRSLNPYLLLLFLVWVPSVVTAVDRGAALRLLITLAGVLMVAAITAAMVREGDVLRKLEHTFLLSAALICLLGLVQWAAYQGWNVIVWRPRVSYIPELGRQVFLVFSIFTRRNLMVMMLLGTVAMVFQLARGGWMDRRLRSGLTVLVALSATVILLSFSRSGRVLLGLTLIWAVMTSRHRPAMLRWAATVGIAAGTILMPPQLVHMGLKPTGFSASGASVAFARDRIVVSEEVNPGSTEVRGRLLVTALNMIRRRPLTGVGSGSFKNLDSNPDKRDPHNTYLQIATSAGLPALGAFILIMAVVTGRALAACRRPSASLAKRSLALGALSYLVLALLQSISEDLLYSKVIWMFVGLTSAASFVVGVPGGSEAAAGVSGGDSHVTEENLGSETNPALVPDVAAQARTDKSQQPAEGFGKKGVGLP